MTVLKVYQRSKALSCVLREIDTRIQQLVEKQYSTSHPNSPEQMLDMELKHQAFGREIADLLTAHEIVSAHQDSSFVRQATAESRAKYRGEGIVTPIENQGWLSVTISLVGGMILKIKTPYLLPRSGIRPGRPRGVGKRGKNGAGTYPVLVSLGIAEKATPATRSEISRQVVLCSSYAEAQEQLQRAGLQLDMDTIIRIATRTGEKALDLRQEALQKAIEEPLPEVSIVEGQRIRVCVDGGRSRIRRTNRRSRKKKNGRRPFELEWREPRVVTIDVLNKEGETDRGWRPIYEVSLGHADDVFVLICGLLRMIGAHKAVKIVFLADGAEWIWNRVHELREWAEIPKERMEIALDYWHATEHIADVLKACKNLNESERTSWLKRLRKILLKRNGAKQVIEELRPLAKGRRGKKINKEIAYLEKHLEHMEYWRLRKEKLPIGSGVVESTVRRIVNLRFKSASMCWLEERLESLLYLRAILKSGRWDDAVRGRLTNSHFLIQSLQTDVSSL